MVTTSTITILALYQRGYLMTNSSNFQHVGNRLLSIALKGILFATLSVHASANEIRATFLATCPTTAYPKAGTQPEALETLALGIASAFVGNLVDAGLAALKKVLVPEARSIEGYFLQEGLYAFRTQRGNETTSRVILNPDLACLVVAVGDFGPSAGPWQLPFEADPDRKDGAVQTLMDKLALKAAPKMYLEAVRELSVDRTAVTWRPTRLYIGEYLNDSFFAGSSRGISFEMNLYKPGQDKAFTTETFSFDEVTKPWRKGSDDLGQGKRGQWLSIPAASKTSDIEGLTPDQNGRPFDPFTLNIRVVESPKPYQLAQMFSDAVTSKSADIKQAVQQVVIPTEKKAAATNSKQAALTALQTYQTDLSAAANTCAAANVGSSAGQLNCNIAKGKASLSRDAATAACGAASGVAACANIPAIP
jgi:hypothetical protein